MPFAACYHCGLPVVEAGRNRAAVLGAVREFCCAGCKAVANTIVAADFERYYESREAPGGERAPLPGALPSSEVYDDPDAQRQFVATAGDASYPGALQATLILDRIRCATCLWLNEQSLRRVPGVLRADVNYATHRAQVAWDPRRTRLSAIIEALRAVGYDAWPFDPQRQSALECNARRKALWRLFVAGFGAMQVMMYAIPAYIDEGGTLSAEAEQLMRWASLVLTLPVILFACTPFFSAAWADLRARRVSLDTPIALGILAGYAASVYGTLSGSGEVYFDSITMLVFLLLAARYVELAARQRAGRELDHLLRWMPSAALRLARLDAAPEKVPAHALAAGDLVLVPAGERVPADGVVLRGASSADESLLTGEARPVAKGPGAVLVGGSVNLEQSLVMRVTRAGAETQAAAIGRLVERAAAGRPRLIERADGLARALTYVVLAATAGAFLYWLHAEPDRAMWVAVAVLVVTCPCALALAAPIALTSASAQLLAHGAVLTRSRAIEALARVTDVVLDKTGTLTEGRFRLSGMVALGTRDAQWCARLAAALEAHGRHPIGRAFAGHASGALPRLEQMRQFAGHGLEAVHDGQRMRIGTQAFCAALAGAPLSGRVARPDARFTPLYLASEQGWLAAFLLEDQLRAGAVALVRALQAQGLRVHLLSGDAPQVVEAYAGRLGIADWRGGAAPQDKHAYVERLQREGRMVAMIGDGLNDAPVLARADVSIAMGGGADLAQLQSDLVLTGNRLGAVLDARDIAARAMQLIRQNFGWALAYNAIALPLATAGAIGPWEAAIGMAGSSFIVVLNALRMRKGKPDRSIEDAAPAAVRASA